MAIAVMAVAFQVSMNFHVSLTRNSPERPNPATGEIHQFDVRGPGDVFITAQEKSVADLFWLPPLLLFGLIGLYFLVFGPPSEDERALLILLSIVIVGVQMFFFPGTFFGHV